MGDYESIGGMIKEFIKFRNRTILETAEAMKIKYTTFSAQLNNDTLTAETLFRLAGYLDIDLNWLLVVLGYHGPVSAIERETIPRMQDDFRKEEHRKVLQRLDALIKENPTSTPDTRRELLKEFHNNMFYLLDVLIPDEYDLYMISDRGNTKYYVDTHQHTRGHPVMAAGRRKPINVLLEGFRALDIAIEDRKDQL